MTYVDLEGPFDTLQIYGGDGKLAAAITTPVYNNVSKSGQYTVIQEGSNLVMIKFTTDASFRQKGFIMQYIAETPAATSGGTTPYNITFGLQIGGGYPYTQISFKPTFLTRHEDENLRKLAELLYLVDC